MTGTTPKLALPKYDYKVNANRTITLEIAYTIDELYPVMDSSTMTMKDWDKIATKIQEKLVQKRNPNHLHIMTLFSWDMDKIRINFVSLNHCRNHGALLNQSL